MTPFFNTKDFAKFASNVDGPFCYISVQRRDTNRQHRVGVSHDTIFIMHYMVIDLGPLGTPVFQTVKIRKMPRSMVREHLSCLDDDRPLRERA